MNTRAFAPTGAPLTSIIQTPCAHPPVAEPAAAYQRKAVRGFAGFTLIELMIVVSVMGILSAVALPSFESHLQRARRADLLVSIMQIQSAQERFRGNGTSYGNLTEIGVPSVSSGGHYALQATPAAAEGYDVFAEAIGTQARDKDCHYMKISALRLNFVYASGPDTSVANPDETNRKCWNL